MAVAIDTTSAKYQAYMTGLENLRTDMLPRLKAFKSLGKEKQKWWLERDPLLRRLIRLSCIIDKHVNIRKLREEVIND